MKSKIIYERAESILEEKLAEYSNINLLLENLTLELSELDKEKDKILEPINQKSKKIKKVLEYLVIGLSGSLFAACIIETIKGNIYRAENLIMSVVGVVLGLGLTYISVVAWRIKKIEKSKELQNIREQIELKRTKIKILTEKKDKTLEELAEITKSFVDKNNEVGMTSIQKIKNEVNEDIIEVEVEKHSKPYTRTKKKD